MQSLDMATTELREVNATLQAQTPASNQTEWVIDNPRGAHAVAVGLDTPISVTVPSIITMVTPSRLLVVTPYFRQCAPPEFIAMLPAMAQASWLDGSGA